MGDAGEVRLISRAALDVVEAGVVADARMHDLRHAHASHTVMTLYIPDACLGTDGAAPTNRYVHLDHATLSRTAERVPSHRAFASARQRREHASQSPTLSEPSRAICAARGFPELPTVSVLDIFIKYKRISNTIKEYNSGDKAESTAFTDMNPVFPSQHIDDRHALALMLQYALIGPKSVCLRRIAVGEARSESERVRRWRSRCLRGREPPEGCGDGERRRHGFTPPLMPGGAMSRLVFLASAAAVLALSACGGGGGSVGEPFRPSPRPVAPGDEGFTPDTERTVGFPTPFHGRLDHDVLDHRTRIAKREADKLSAMHDRGGTGQIVGTIESGANRDHPDLAGQFAHVCAMGLCNGSAGSDDGRPELDRRDHSPLYDTDGHGTSINGVAAAKRNGIGVYGMAYEARIASWGNIHVVFWPWGNIGRRSGNPRHNDLWSELFDGRPHGTSTGCGRPACTW